MGFGDEARRTGFPPRLQSVATRSVWVQACDPGVWVLTGGPCLKTVKMPLLGCLHLVFLLQPMQLHPWWGGWALAVACLWLVFCLSLVFWPLLQRARLRRVGACLGHWRL